MVEIIALLVIVGAAALFLGYRLFRVASGKAPACEGCDVKQCPGQAPCSERPAEPSRKTPRGE